MTPSNFTSALIVLMLSLLTSCSTSQVKPTQVLPDVVTQETEAASPAQTVQEGGFSFTGKISNSYGTTLPQGTKLAVFWTVDGKDGDYVYLLGGGTVSQDTFTVVLADSSIPDEALTAGFLGVAIIVALPPEAILPPIGKVKDKKQFGTVIKTALGHTKNHALIYVKSNPPEELAEKLRDFWSHDFKKAELQCGEGVKTTKTFDDIKPVSCEDVVLTISKTFNWINWT